VITPFQPVRELEAGMGRGPDFNNLPGSELKEIHHGDRESRKMRACALRLYSAEGREILQSGLQGSRFRRNGNCLQL
jgi:hypothetical protein